MADSRRRIWRLFTSRTTNLNFYCKTVATYSYLLLMLNLLLLCGDIEVNPGPVKYPCGLCDRPVANNHRGLECDGCVRWYHIKCGGVSGKLYKDFTNNQQGFTWICPQCAMPSFRSSFFEDLIEHASDNSFSVLSDFDCDVDELENAPLTSSPAAPRQRKDHSDRSKRKLKLMTVNCDGLKGKKKQKQLAALLDLEKPDIVMGTESHLDGTINTSEVFPVTYKVQRKDRNMYGGGVFIAYKEDIVASEVTEVGKSCELTMIKVKSGKLPPVYFGSFYRTTDSDDSSHHQV